ncbi:MAG: nucleotidyltransferase domain-containing protein [Candidatus Latescibacteria bacterium]|nr:nucleotidyltransferase domain-containing protein [Candidatus Latescibacterota bacterium]
MDSTIPRHIHNTIVARLDHIEVEEDVRIFFACESGSRAWGFPSTDSDYDVRFLSIHPPEWYLSVDMERKRDVIERPINDHLDLNGWDLRKALWLLRKSNPPLLEWLASPIVYREYSAIPQRLRELKARYYSPRACAYHYLHMAKGNYREYLHGARVWLKKYLYVLRPLLAIEWIIRDLGPVPMEFERLIEAVIEDRTLRWAIDQLLEAKKAGDELAVGPRIDPISLYLEEALPRLECLISDTEVRTAPIDELNAVFREGLREMWDMKRA